ncbi:MAG: cutinase family protein [Acidobacteria bacterium]|nr:cutinase family protein [Acidobacteriota bacterium]
MVESGVATGDKRTSFWIAIAGAVVVAAAIVVAVVLVLPQSAEPGSVTDLGVWIETESCPNVFFVGARGTDQDPGIGPQLSDAYSIFLTFLRPGPGRDIGVAVYPLDYPAARGRFGDSSKYEESVAAGAGELRAAVDVLASQCAAARIVVAGYSQGAQVISVADLANLGEATIDAMILLANPVFVPDDATEKAGDFNPDQGGLVGRVSIDGELAGRTIQVCLRGDPVCQSGSLAIWVHSNDYFGSALDPAAEFAANEVNPNL